MIMTVKLWGIVVVAAMVLVSVVYVVGNKPKTQQQSIISPVASPAIQATVVPTGSVIQTSSRYVSYSKTAFDAAADKKRVLYFYATWCPICKVVNEELTQKSEEIPPDVVVFKTDYDSEKDLKTKYGVTYQHTFIQVDAAGKKVTAWNGGGVEELGKRVR